MSPITGDRAFPAGGFRLADIRPAFGVDDVQRQHAFGMNDINHTLRAHWQLPMYWVAVLDYTGWSQRDVFPGRTALY